jgi:hypothetical protein
LKISKEKLKSDTIEEREIQRDEERVKMKEKELK